MDRSTDLLILEYERSSEFCNHVDDVRNVLTSFFLTAVAGVAVAIGKFQTGGLSGSQLAGTRVGLVALCWLVSVIGGLFTCTLARLRRVQLERYMIMNGILDSVLSADVRSLVPYSSGTVVGAAGARVARRTAGSYFWTVALMLPSAMLAGIGVWVLRDGRGAHLTLAVSVAVALLTLALLDGLHFRLAKP